MSQLPFALAVVCAIALILDRLLGEPRRHHPLVWFGTIAGHVEHRLNQRSSRFSGAIAVLVMIVPPVLLVFGLQKLLSDWPVLDVIFNCLVLMFVVGWQSLKEHAGAVVQPLSRSQLDEARRALSMIVSRETNDLDEQQIAGSVVESILENGHDSVFASLFWFAVAGPAGAILHRLVNTLDAMWGYRNARYQSFGWAAARFDDVLGYVPARLTAISYAVCGCSQQAFASWREQAPLHKSPNAGPVMAAGAGALNVRIGGAMVYDGVQQDKPILGVGRSADVAAIASSIKLVHRALVLWVLVAALIGIVL